MNMTSSNWIAFVDREPQIKSNGRGDCSHQKVLVTNNLSARDAFGDPSHVWLGSPFIDSETGEWCVHGGGQYLTHWFDPFAGQPDHSAAGSERDTATELCFNERPCVKAVPAEEGSVALKAERSFQGRVQPWMLACFGEEISDDPVERNHRFFEEATETVQANGMTRSEAHQLVDYTYDRPIGELKQEVGGAMVTLAALCLAMRIDMYAAAEAELARIWAKVEAIRIKQANKPKYSALPMVPRAVLAQPVAHIVEGRTGRSLVWDRDIDGYQRDGLTRTELFTARLGWLPVPDGWLVRDDGKSIVVEKAGIGGVVVQHDEENIAGSILHQLARDLLAAPGAAHPNVRSVEEV